MKSAVAVSDDRRLAYALLRIAFGVNFLGHGWIRLYDGAGGFAAATVEHMSKSPLPHGFVYVFGYAIPSIEAVLGGALIAGLMTRATLVGGALFMMALTVGVTANQQWDIAGQQLVYSVVFFLLLYLVEYNGFAVDEVLRRRGSVQ